MNASLTRRVATVAVAVLGLAAAARATDDWTVTTADFATRPGAVRGLGPDGLRLDDRAVPPDQFVSLQRVAAGGPAGPGPAFTLALVGGDRLVGSPAGVVGETLTWNEPTLGPVAVPFARLAAVGRGRDVAVPDEPPKQDVLTLANGDVVRGLFTDAKADAFVIQTDGGPTAVPAANVARIAFAATAGPGKAAGYRVRLTDGSSVTAAEATIDGDAVTLTLPGKGAKPNQVRLGSVLAVERLDGPVGWLSSMTPTENVQQPYFGGAATWPARFDRAVDGSPIVADGRVVEKGIGVHAYSRVTFDVSTGGWAAFRTQYAIDSRRDDPRTLAEVTVRVKLDGKVVYEKAGVRVGPASDVVRVDLGGAKRLTLECDYGPAGDVQGRLNWIQPALLRAAAATRP